MHRLKARMSSEARMSFEAGRDFGSVSHRGHLLRSLNGQTRDERLGPGADGGGLRQPTMANIWPYSSCCRCQQHDEKLKILINRAKRKGRSPVD
jgi:hypothetical protein